MATFAVPPPQTRDWRELPDAKTIDTGTKRLVVFLDYDGTLTPIVEASDAAVLAAPMRAAIARLARHAPVAVVSGRARGKRDNDDRSMIYCTQKYQYSSCDHTITYIPVRVT